MGMIMFTSWLQSKVLIWALPPRDYGLLSSRTTLGDWVLPSYCVPARSPRASETAPPPRGGHSKDWVNPPGLQIDVSCHCLYLFYVVFIPLHQLLIHLIGADCLPLWLSRSWTEPENLNYFFVWDRISCSPAWALTCQAAKMALNFWLSCLCCQSVAITGVYHNTCFTQCWG